MPLALLVDSVVRVDALPTLVEGLWVVLIALVLPSLPWVLLVVLWVGFGANESFDTTAVPAVVGFTWELCGVLGGPGRVVSSVGSRGWVAMLLGVRDRRVRVVSGLFGSGGTANASQAAWYIVSWREDSRLMMQDPQLTKGREQEQGQCEPHGVRNCPEYLGRKRMKGSMLPWRRGRGRIYIPP